MKSPIIDREWCRNVYRLRPPCAIPPFPSPEILQNGPRRQGSASPRKTGAPLTAPATGTMGNFQPELTRTPVVSEYAVSAADERSSTTRQSCRGTSDTIYRQPSVTRVLFG